MDAPAQSSPAVRRAEVSETLSRGRRLQLLLLATLGSLLVRIIGRTLRYEQAGAAEHHPATRPVPTVYCFWHRCVLPATHHFRDLGIAVMTSRSRDGEIIARIIKRFGFRAVRGSSSRGALGALRGMHRALAAGRHAAFTIDGPRGPLYVAKPGPVLLARNARAAVVCFHVAVERAWELPSWDRFLVPKPFSRVRLHWSEPMDVPEDADETTMKRLHERMQATLDRVRVEAERAFDR